MGRVHDEIRGGEDRVRDEVRGGVGRVHDAKDSWQLHKLLQCIPYTSNFCLFTLGSLSEEVQQASQNVDPVNSNTNNGMLSQHFMMHGAHPLSPNYEDLNHTAIIIDTLSGWSKQLTKFQFAWT